MTRQQAEGVAAAEPILVTRGEDARVLVIAFTGFGGRLGMRPYDFMALTGTLAYSRVLVRDPFRAWYHRGLGGDVTSFLDLTHLLQSHARALGPETIITIGNSSGGYAALLAGHLMKADYAHALAPQTYLDAGNILRYRDAPMVRGHWRELLRLHRNRSARSEYLDLRRALSQDNRKTRYFVHVCAGADRDRQRAEHLTGLARLSILCYPGARHQVAGVMARHGFLREILKPELQQQLETLHRREFGAAGARAQPVASVRGRRERIIALIQQAGLREVGRAEIEASTDLTGELGLDSVASLEILLGLENEFRVQIDHTRVSEADLRSVAALDSLVVRSPTR